MSAYDLLEQQITVHDLALDFAEHEVGCYNFKENWVVLKAKECPVEKIRRWLHQVEPARVDLADKISNVLDDLAARNVTWLAPYTRSIES